MMWTIVGSGAAMLAGQVMRRAMDRGWQAARDDEPPQRLVGSGRIGWKTALLWTMGSAAVVGAAELLAEESAQRGFAKATGRKPPR